MRAELDRPHSPEGDPDAQRLLCAGMHPLSSPGMWPQIAARTRFFDELVRSAISTGVRQVVVCGAGYDDRALRFRTSGVRFFELDHPATQADKAERLRATGKDLAALTPAPVDFRTDDVAAVLDGCGHDAGRPSLFICEGLLVYLDRPTCLRLFAGLRSRSVEGALLAASLAVHDSGADSDHVATVANARRRDGVTEPWRTILPLDAHLALLAESGWRARRTVDAAELAADAIAGRTQLVIAEPGPRHP